MNKKKQKKKNTTESFLLFFCFVLCKTLSYSNPNLREGYTVVSLITPGMIIYPMGMGHWLVFLKQVIRYLWYNVLRNKYYNQFTLYANNKGDSTIIFYCSYSHFGNQWCVHSVMRVALTLVSIPLLFLDILPNRQNGVEDFDKIYWSKLFRRF